MNLRSLRQISQPGLRMETPCRNAHPQARPRRLPARPWMLSLSAGTTPRMRPIHAVPISPANPSLSTHTSKGVVVLTRMRHMPATRCVLPCIPSPLGDFTLKETRCLRRILPCAWSTRQRTCFPTRRAFRFASSNVTSVRCRAVRAFLSRTGSSSFAIKDSGTSASADRQPTSSAIDRKCDDARQREAHDGWATVDSALPRTTSPARSLVAPCDDAWRPHRPRPP
jgi:hypothetical protein